MMRIAAEQASTGGQLLAALTRAVEALGALVVVDPDGENLVKRVGAKREFAIPPDDGPYHGPVCAHVLVQGLPNLLHEVGHIVLRGCLDDDHAIDYQAIPFDLATAAGRAVLFEELACCVLSCAYAPVDTRAWFAEQVEIQPIFYGWEDDVPAFWRVAAACYAAHRPEADATVDTALHRTRTLLQWSGAPATLAAPARRLTLCELLLSS